MAVHGSINNSMTKSACFKYDAFSILADVLNVNFDQLNALEVEHCISMVLYTVHYTSGGIERFAMY